MRWNKMKHQLLGSISQKLNKLKFNQGSIIKEISNLYLKNISIDY